MTLEHWSDYHAWPVSPDTMQAARLALSDKAYGALFGAVKLDAGTYLAPREAIEDAALAMPAETAIQFLGAVYQLDHAEGVKLLAAIRSVRRVV